MPEYSAALRRLPGKEAEGMILIKVLLGTNMEEITAGEWSSCMSLGETRGDLPLLSIEMFFRAKLSTC